jgi:hypothetical protein
MGVSLRSFQFDVLKNFLFLDDLIFLKIWESFYYLIGVFFGGTGV